jgi:hypothetical protein
MHTNEPTMPTDMRKHFTFAVQKRETVTAPAALRFKREVIDQGHARSFWLNKLEQDMAFNFLVALMRSGPEARDAAVSFMKDEYIKAALHRLKKGGPLLKAIKSFPREKQITILATPEFILNAPGRQSHFYIGNFALRFKGSEGVKIMTAKYAAHRLSANYGNDDIMHHVQNSGKFTTKEQVKILKSEHFASGYMNGKNEMELTANREHLWRTGKREGEPYPNHTMYSDYSHKYIEAVATYTLEEQTEILSAKNILRTIQDGSYNSSGGARYTNEKLFKHLQTAGFNQDQLTSILLNCNFSKIREAVWFNNILELINRLRPEQQAQVLSSNGTTSDITNSRFGFGNLRKLFEHIKSFDEEQQTQILSSDYALSSWGGDHEFADELLSHIMTFNHENQVKIFAARGALTGSALSSVRGKIAAHIKHFAPDELRQIMATKDSWEETEWQLQRDKERGGDTPLMALYDQFHTNEPAMA